MKMYMTEYRLSVIIDVGIEMSGGLKQIVRPLLSWFDENARVLPWRDEPSPYRVWVSEIMLQQTRVEAVKPYFQRFVEALPDVNALASCPEDKLLKLWEGLGYYNRVRNMQTAAQMMLEQYDGRLPADYEALLSLKGIGSYTAGAVASIAYGIPVPAVDGNVLRVISRVTASEEDIMKASVKKKIEQDIQRIIPQERAGAFNQALMELGAMICVPNGIAKCEECPLNMICLARERDIVMELPKKAQKKQRRIEKRTVLVIRDGDKAAIRKRPDKGLLAGMYELPNEEGYMSETEIIEYLKRKNLSPIRIRRLEDSKHIFSHIEWHMRGYVIQIEETEQWTGKDYLFVEPKDTEKKYPIPAAFGAYTGYLQIKLGQEKYKE